MNRTAHLTLTLAAAAVAASGLGIAATSAGASTSPASAVLHLVEHRVQESQIDLGKTGPSTGDELLLSGTLTGPGGKPAGDDSGLCTVTVFDQQRQFAICTVALRLAGGQLLVAGQESLSGTDQSFAVTGGTGAFRHARGQLVVHQINPTTRQVTVDLR